MNKRKKIKRGTLFVVSAPTGGGKSTVVTQALQGLEKKFPISRIVTYTTRPSRPGENPGVDYHFVSKELFKKLQSENKFAEITQYNNNFYGSPRDFLLQLDEGKSFIAITDRAGVVFYKNLCPDAILIWIAPPSLEVLQQRLKLRGSETAASLQQRLALAEKELALEQASPLCSHHIINDQLPSAVNQLVEIVESYLGERANNSCL